MASSTSTSRFFFVNLAVVFVFCLLYTEIEPQQNFNFNNFPYNGYTPQTSSFQQGYNVPSVSGTGNFGTGNTGTGSSTDGGLEGMCMFLDMFDWTKDLRSDRRFQQCRVPDSRISQISADCAQKEFYYGMNAKHREAVMMVKQILMGPSDAREAICLAGAMRDRMNPNVWIRGVMATVMGREDLYSLPIPPTVEVMPDIFINSASMQEARSQASISPQSRTCVVVDGNVGRDNGIENLLWYWREDVAVNSFHLNWHLSYPFTGTTVRADRRGELFYFSHHSHLARYHAERLSNGLGRVVPQHIDYNIAIPEPYNPHLDDRNSQLNWTARRPNAVFQDAAFIAIEGVPPNVSVSDRNTHIRRVEEAIFNRVAVTANGQSFRLDTTRAVDTLGDITEASIFSPNGNFYGPFGFHNEGHVLISLIEDPQNRTNLPPGVMLEVATSMRDPVFYTYHTPVDNIFDQNKQTLIPYQPTGGEFPLTWPGVEITHMHVDSEDGGRYNSLKTFYNRKMYELSRGLDFNRTQQQGPIQACITHLDHYEFNYEISVNRQNFVTSDIATVRIFLAPRFDEHGRRYSINEQRRLFFILDMFTTNLQIGPNVIRRSSTESTLTIPIPQSVHEIDVIKNQQRPYCGCGWPHHLLIPRGTEQGMIFDLFVMLTNGVEDFVPSRAQQSRQGTCKPAPIYCGRLNDTYPDARPMGYPFDRLAYTVNPGGGGGQKWWQRRKPVETLEEYVQGIPNMAAIQVQITHLRNANPQPFPQGGSISAPQFNQGGSINAPQFSQGGSISAPQFNQGGSISAPQFNQGGSINAPQFSQGGSISAPQFNQGGSISAPQFNQGGSISAPQFNQGGSINGPQFNQGGSIRAPLYSQGGSISAPKFSEHDSNPVNVRDILRIVQDHEVSQTPVQYNPRPFTRGVSGIPSQFSGQSSNPLNLRDIVRIVQDHDVSQTPAVQYPSNTRGFGYQPPRYFENAQQAYQWVHA